MIIRTMLPSEFETVCEIANTSKFTKDLPYVARKWHGENNIRVLIDNDEIVAYAYYVVTKYRDYVNLYWLGTKPGNTGKGYGKIFLSHIKSEALNSGKEYLHFKVGKKNEAKGFYEKLNFHPSSETEKEYIYIINIK